MPAATHAVGAGPVAIASGDFNGDGAVDLAVATGIGFLRPLWGTGTGDFQSGASHAAGTWPSAVVAGDCNGDANVDLAIANTFGTVTVLLGNGQSSFLPGVSHSSGVAAPGSMASGDFNADGALDLVVADRDSANSNPRNVGVMLGTGTGAFQPAATYAAGGSPSFLVAHDFDSDGTVDLAVTNRRMGTLSVLLGRSDGTFQVASSYGGVDATQTRCCGGRSAGRRLADRTARLRPQRGSSRKRLPSRAAASSLT